MKVTQTNQYMLCLQESSGSKQKQLFRLVKKWLLKLKTIVFFWVTVYMWDARNV